MTEDIVKQTKRIQEKHKQVMRNITCESDEWECLSQALEEEVQRGGDKQEQQGAA